MQVFTGDTGTRYGMEQIRQLGLGVMLCSSSVQVIGRPLHHEVPVALDNGAFPAWSKKVTWDEAVFLRTLDKCDAKGLELRFVVCPDIVAGGLRSLDFSLEWAERLPERPLYLAVQDGMNENDIAPHLQRFAGLFVGGSLDWKMRTGERWVKLAHTRDIPCHIGRVGTYRRLQWAVSIGADSVDSTSFVRNGTWEIVSNFQADVQPCLF